MNNIYVDELPKNCEKCFCYSYSEGFCNCECWYQKYGEIKDVAAYTHLGLKENERPADCLLKLITDRLAEERKIVCNQARVDIRSLFNSYASSLIDYCIWNKNADENYKLYNNFKRIINDRLDKVLDLFDKRIDQIERGEG